jgi:hypothetical protein
MRLVSHCQHDVCLRRGAFSPALGKELSDPAARLLAFSRQSVAMDPEKAEERRAGCSAAK